MMKGAQSPPASTSPTQPRSPSPMHSVSPVLSTSGSSCGSYVPHHPSISRSDKSAHSPPYNTSLGQVFYEEFERNATLKHEFPPTQRKDGSSPRRNLREIKDQGNNIDNQQTHSAYGEDTESNTPKENICHYMTRNLAQQQHMHDHPKRKIHPRPTNKASDFRSFAIYCEVKLAEMLNKEKQTNRNHGGANLNISNGPNVYRTNICSELLGEICEMSMPFARVLGHIRNELLSAIYSNYVVPQDGSLAFQQVPYFIVVEKLEKKNIEIEQEHERWKEILHARQHDISQIEQQMEELREQAFAAQSYTRELEEKLNTALKSLDTATAQVKRLKKELSKSRQEEAKAHAKIVEQEAEKEKFERLKILHTQLVNELQACQITLETTRQEAADRVPKQELDQAQAKIVELTGKLALSIPKDLKSGGMTPRPNWMVLRGKASSYRAPTVEQANEICKINEQLSENLNTLRLDTAAAKVALAEVTEKLSEVEGLLPPDPLVLSPDILASLSEAANKSIKAMGVGEELPRFLRCTYDFVRATNPPMQTIQKVIADVWDARGEQIQNKANVIPLFDFMYTHLVKKMGQHIDVVEFMYNMLFTIKKTPKPWPSDVELFQLVLLGQISEEVYWDRVRMFKTLYKNLDVLNGKQLKDGRRMLKISEASSMLEKVFPRKPPKQLLVLQSALKESSSDQKNIFYRSEDSPDNEFHPPDIFVDTVGHQHLDEIKDYTDGLQKAVRNFTKGKGIDGQVPLDDISASIIGYDAHKTQSEVDSLLVVATNLGCTSEINVAKALGFKVDVNTVLTRMTRKCLLKPSGNYDYGQLLKRKTIVSQ